MSHLHNDAGVPEPATGELIGRLAQQSTELIRSEIRMAQLEMSQKAKRAGLGAGLFGGAGIVALYGLGVAIAVIILVLSLLLVPWLAALIVAVVLFLIAGVLALVGKKQVSQATPAGPQQTIDNVKQDVATLKGGSNA
ncbi:phage holin family protein [soil metagenome]